jgi:exodeoxyribonuclease VII small subunit
MGSKKTFEQCVKQLEEIVQELENGDIPLELAIKKFEEGIELSKFCSRRLEETEQRITLLLKDEKGEPLEKPFTAEAGGNGS